VSDLQCPARFLVLGGAATADEERLRHERVAAVYAGTRDDAGPATRLGEGLGVPVHPVVELTVEGVLDQAPETMEVLAELADLHRGETVVVLATGDRPRRVEVTVDGDGTRVEEVSRADGT